MALEIPGNIKLTYLPFVLDPSRAINKSVATSNILYHEPLQLFSFKNRDSSKFPGGFGLIHICPLSYMNFMETDISHKLLYGETNQNSITFNDILNTIPCILIREFQPDTKLQLAFNLFGDAIGTIQKLFKGVQGDSLLGTLKNIAERLGNIMSSSFNFLVGIGEPNAYSVLKDLINLFNRKNGLYMSDTLVDTYVVKFVYVMYYSLLSCTSTNVYELPCKVSNNILYQSDGSGGWEGGTIGLDDAFDKLPGGKLIKNLVSSLTDNIRISYTPFWDASKGYKTTEPAVEIKFDLFNDSEEAALINFIFVNTIVPNNKWIQYNVFLHSPSLYDIKLEGYNRLFACSGKFQVTLAGVLRNPSYSFFEKLKAHINTGSGDGMKDMNFDLTDGYIKIPDVYLVTLTFLSLLPANFNSYMFAYSHNNNIIATAPAGKDTRRESALTIIKNEITDKLVQKVKAEHGIPD